MVRRSYATLICWMLWETSSVIHLIPSQIHCTSFNLLFTKFSRRLQVKETEDIFSLFYQQVLSVYYLYIYEGFSESFNKC